MRYVEVFNEVVSIMHHDYAGCVDNDGGDNPHEYERIIRDLEEKGELDDFNFGEIVKDYIAYFKDYHVYFHVLNGNKPFTIGFKVRKYKDKLYVISVSSEKSLEVGDALVEVDGMDINTLADKYKRRLHFQPDERQFDWYDILKKHSSATVERKDGSKFTLNIGRYNFSSSGDDYTLKFIKDDIALFKFIDFNDPDAIKDLVEDNKERLKECKKWIIDVRTNNGGSDMSYVPLLGYMLKKGQGITQDYDIKFLMTERNCDGRVKDFKKMLEETKEDNIEVRNSIKNMIRWYEDNRGKGFINMDIEDDDDEMIEGLYENPEKIVVLTDTFCGSSGDQFVRYAMQSEKVTVVGRNTLGVLDYSNCAFERIDNRFNLTYATSRDGNIDKGEGMKGIGIAPHIYIPWTPEMFERDSDMEKAFEILNE